VSYLILAVTWLGFNGAISIHTVLLKRQDFLHFFIQYAPPRSASQHY